MLWHLKKKTKYFKGDTNITATTGHTKCSAMYRPHLRSTFYRSLAIRNVYFHTELHADGSKLAVLLTWASNSCCTALASECTGVVSWCSSQIPNMLTNNEYTFCIWFQKVSYLLKRENIFPLAPNIMSV